MIKQTCTTQQVRSKFDSLHLVELPVGELITTCEALLQTSAPYALRERVKLVCNLSLKMGMPLVRPDQSLEGFAFKALRWLNGQLEGTDTGIEFSREEWTGIKGFDSWLNILVNGWTLNPKTHAFDRIFDQVVACFEQSFNRIFAVLKIALVTEHAQSEALALMTANAALYEHTHRFEYIRFLSDQNVFPDLFTSLAKSALLLESRDINRYREVHGLLMEKKMWAVGKAYAYRILALIDNYFPSEDKTPVTADLVYANLQLGEVDEAVENYRKYWIEPAVDRPFPYAGELIFALHDRAPHHPCIRHLTDHLDEAVHSSGLDRNDGYALLTEIKRLEFADGWIPAKDIYGKLWELDNESWLPAAACFLAYNVLHRGEEFDLIKTFCFPVWDQADGDRYARIKGIVRLCTERENPETLLRQAVQLFHGQRNEGDEGDTGGILPDGDFIFSGFLLPVILSALIESRNLPRYEAYLSHPASVYHLPESERIFLKNLIDLEKQLQTRLRKPREANDFIYYLECALEAASSLGHLQILARKFSEADRYLPKDKNNSYLSFDALIFEKVLLFLVSGKLEALLGTGRNSLSAKADEAGMQTAIRTMTIHNMASTIGAFINRTTASMAS